MRQTLVDYARSKGRDYITPEDVGEVLEAGGDAVGVAIDVLAAVGKQTVGLEDASLCAFLAWEALEKGRKQV